ncbi:MAG: glycine--tRNA ligase subunit alpha, partial [Endomicrobia bacterium]|nr:glycine--tRNA ligase subunit alpha [Endomicrobiia bacterium]
TYGEVHLEDEKQWSKYNFEIADTGMLKQHFNDWEKEAKRLSDMNLPLPAYDAVMKCSHLFNLLDARGAISVSERVGYVLRVRTLAKTVAEEYLKLQCGV